MQNWFPILLVLVVILFSLKFLFGAGGDREDVEGRGDDGRLHYTPRKYILTSAEFAFYKALRLATGDRYNISPQVHLDGLFDVRKDERFQKKYRSKIDKKSVDFVLFDKETVQAVVAIELDDRTHDRRTRHVRDEFVNQLFTRFGPVLLRVPVQASYDPEQLRQKISELLSRQNLRGTVAA